MPEIHIRHESERSRFSEAFVWVNVPVDDLGCNHRSLLFHQYQVVVFNCYGFFQVIDHGMSLKAIDKVSEVIANEFFSLPVQDKPLLIKDEYGFSNNKDFKSATAGLYGKVEHVHFQKIKQIKISRSGRVENISRRSILRRRRRHNKKDKDDEDDGEDNRRPSDFRVLSFILVIIILLTLFLIMLSSIVWVMS